MLKTPSRIHLIADPRRRTGGPSASGNVRRFRLARLSADGHQRSATARVTRSA